MKNAKKTTRVVTCVAPTGGVTSGVPVAINGFVVVPLVDAAAGENFTADIGQDTTVVELAAESGTGKAFTQFDALYWDSGNSRVTKTASGNTSIGKAEAAKAAGTALARVLLNG